ncbi:class I SAM-dependent methyltransferase [Thermodesulfobacteriota bacterium]
MMCLVKRVCPYCFSIEFDVILDLLIDDFVLLNPTYSIVEIQAMGFNNDQRFKIVRCQKCGFVYALHALNKELTHHLYSQVIDTKKALSFRSQKVKTWQLSIIYLLFSMLDKQSEKQVAFLDFGCGYGEILHIASACGAVAFGVEIEPGRINSLHKQGFFVEDSIDKLVTHAPFDLVYCKDVLEHVFNPDQVIKAIASVTKPGGFGFFDVPNYSAYMIEKIQKDFRDGKGLPDKDVNPWEHVNYFSENLFRNMLERHGFNVIAPNSALIRPVVIKNITDSYRLVRKIIGAYIRGKVGTGSLGTSLFVKRL